MKVSDTRAERWSAVLDDEFIECGEAVHELVKCVWEDHTAEGEIAEVCECQGVVVHGVGDLV